MTRPRARRLLPIVLVLTLSGSGAASRATAAAACMAGAPGSRTGHISLWLAGLPSGATTTHPFYFAPEDARSGRFEIVGGAHVCNESASVRYSTEGEVATESVDFQPVAGRASFTIIHTASPAGVDIPILEDGEVEAPVESFRVTLSKPRNGSLRIPWEAPFHIIDVDGVDRATLDPVPYLVRESAGAVGIAVFRAGPARTSISVPYVVDATGASPATPGEDLTVSSPNPLWFGPGERMKMVQIEIVDDGVAEPDERIRVSLTDPSHQAVTETTVTIDGEIDASPPRSRFHHPRMGWKYARDDYRIREIHVFTDDGDGSGVARMHLALRRNSMDGTCSWWDGQRFIPDDCSRPRWLRMRSYEPGWFYRYRLDRLIPSVNTRFRSYTAFARGIDSAGNVEDELIAGRNMNTFEVTRR
jgi:hypothetical protein